MKLSYTKTKSSTIYYVSKSYRDRSGKATSKTVERLGTLDEIKLRSGDMDPLEWAKNYVKELTESEKGGTANVAIQFSPTMRIDPNKQNLYAGGYLFLQDIYYSLGLNKICSSIISESDAKYNLNSIFSRLIYSRILNPSSKLSSFNYSSTLLEKPDFQLHQIYRALELISSNSDFIQSKLYKNSQKVFPRNKGILYYDCTNYYFEIEEEDGFRKYGYSKEHRPNPIVQMGLFMDSSGMPLSFCINPGNTNEQITMLPLEKKILEDYGIENIVVCTDAGLSSANNRKFNSSLGRAFITTQSIKELKQHLKEFCLSPDGWRTEGSNKIYNINEIDEEKDRDRIFYKDRWINEDNFEQHLIVSYSVKYRDYMRNVRSRQIERAQNLISERPSSIGKKRQNDHKRFIAEIKTTPDGEVAEKSNYYIDTAKISEEEQYDGFYAVCTNLEDRPADIVKVNKRRWEIEECFRILKSEFGARPVYLSREDRIKAHFLICFVALMIYRILEHKLSNNYSCEKIIETLRSYNFVEIKGDGYIPAYTRTEITDDLHEAMGFCADYEFISKRKMQEIFTRTKM